MLIIYTKYVLRLIIWEYLPSFYYIFFVKRENLTYAIFCLMQIKMQHFLSWLNLRLTQFSDTEICNFHDDFMFLNEWQSLHWDKHVSR